MRGEKPKFLGNSTVDFWKWQDDTQCETSNEECGCTNPCINQRSDDSLPAGQFVRRRRINVNLRNGLADWHSLFPVA
jgi:hypothetical protein